MSLASFHRQSFIHVPDFFSSVKTQKWSIVENLTAVSYFIQIKHLNHSPFVQLSNLFVERCSNVGKSETVAAT